MKLRILLISLLIAAPAFASISVKRSSKAKTLDITIVEERLSVAVNALELHIARPVQVLLVDDPLITYRARQIAPDAALKAIASAAGMKLTIESDQYWLRDTRTPTVTLDVKDAEARVILESMQKQCGIKNLMIDPNVQGSGTFLFNQVPCAQAFDVVFRSLGLSGVTYPNSVINVGMRPN